MRERVDEERARLEEYKRKWEAEHGQSPNHPQYAQTGQQNTGTGARNPSAYGDEGQSQSSRVDLLQGQAQKQHQGVFGKLEDKLHLSKEERQKHEEEKQKALSEQRRQAAVSSERPVS